MQCVKNALTTKYGSFETEIAQHKRRAIEVCFAQNIAEGNQKDICVLALSDLENKAWERNGPLRDCSICRTFATGAIKALLNTPDDEQKCIRQEMSKAIKSEAEYCLQQRKSSFLHLPDFPDLEEGSYAFKEEVIKSISDHILVHSRLSFCSERRPERAKATRKCLENPFEGYLANHCSVITECENRLPVSCKTGVKDMRKSVCACIRTAQKDLKQRLTSIAQVIRNVVQGSDRGAASIGSASKLDQCVAGIKSLVKTSVNDWIEVIDQTLQKCLKNKPAGQNLGLDSLINVGCRKVIADTTGTAHLQLKTGFDFLNNLVDAMVDRAGRFCRC
ncbi:unnamed protein product [Thelazia callipaeda]|uniref:PMEI domain-containing protein n=1 Tax=Thelazia callipaeda TaxID=103827 RepID=A0A0N5CSD0_THECL|nr:unnamed protein product [Thelazia callipaeda]